MMLRNRVARILDRVLGLQIILVVFGTCLAFGGSVWWAKIALALLIPSLALVAWARTVAHGGCVVLKSPLAALGVLSLVVAVAQLTPLPGRIANMVSPASRSAHALGVLPDRVQVDDASAEIPAATTGRTPATVDRPATLRWIIGAAACLAVFCVCSSYSDRLNHSSIIWGSVVAGFFVATSFGLAQILGGSAGLYGAIQVGKGGVATPTTADVLASPGSTLLRPVVESNTADAAWVTTRPVRTLQFGTMLGGTGSYLALASLGLPLTLGLTLYVIAPRGSRESLRARLRASGRTGVAIVLVLLLIASSGLVGFLAGPVLAIPFLVVILGIGLVSTRSSSLGFLAIGLTFAATASLGAGYYIATVNPDSPFIATGETSVPALKSAWRDGYAALTQFPLLGSGLGTFATISSYYKTTDLTWNTARSSLIQWVVETGLVGVVILGLAGFWALIRLPGSIRRVGSADRVLAYALVGTLICFASVSALHWTVELIAVALAACAVGGTCNRWLAGGTDLFVEVV